MYSFSYDALYVYSLFKKKRVQTSTTLLQALATSHVIEIFYNQNELSQKGDDL